MEKPRDFRGQSGAERAYQAHCRDKEGIPSKGLIKKDFSALDIAMIYEEKAVDAISVLTEEDFFRAIPAM